MLSIMEKRLNVPVSHDSHECKREHISWYTYKSGSHHDEDALDRMQMRTPCNATSCQSALKRFKFAGPMKVPSQ